MNRAEWESAKKDIRSILIPIQKGCNLTEFRKEYRSLIGRELPSAQLGFRSDVELLSSMPDAVRMVPSARGEFHLTAIADETTAHIQKMVGKQKSQKLKPTRNQFRVPPKKEPPPRFRNIPIQRRGLPFQWQEYTVLLVKQFPSGIMLREFQLAFYDLYKINFKFQNFGFSTLDECLQSIPGLAVKTVNNTNYVYFTGYQEMTRQFVLSSSPWTKKAEISKGKVKNCSTLNVTSTESWPSRMDKRSPHLVNTCGTSNVTPLLTTPKGRNLSYSVIERNKEAQNPSPNVPKLKNENSLPPKNASIVKSSPSPSAMATESSPSTVVKRSPHLDNTCGVFEESKNAEPSVSCSPKISSSSPKVNIQDTVRHEKEEPQTIPPFVLKNLQKIADTYEDGIWSIDFPALYEDVIRTDFDLHSLGYTDLGTFIDAVPEIFKRQDVVGVRNKWLIYPANSSKGENKSSLPNSSALLMDSIITNTKQMLQAYPEGIKLEEFEHIYSINCSEPLYVRDFGFNSMENFLSSIASRVPLMVASSRDGKTVFLVETTATRVFQFAPNNEIQEPPPDIVLLYTRFETAQLEPDFDDSKYFEVYTSSIESPSHLYIQIKGPQYTEAMHKLYNDMELFYYSPEGSKYKMLNAHIRVGSVCVALWPSDKHWYRVRIESIPSLECVKVFYFDYGTREEIPTTMLRYMKKKYAQLPAQALQSSLAFLKPARQAVVWDKRARWRMLNLCQDISLMALIDSVTREGVLSLILCDTNGEKDIYINDVLLNEGLADSNVPNVQTQEMFAQLQNNLLIQAAVGLFSPPPAGGVMNVPPPTNLSPDSTLSKDDSPTDSEVFCDDDDEFFEQFYEKVVTVMKRYVKRIHTSDNYIFHILILNGMPYVSCGDISSLIWSSQDADYLMQRLQNREVSLPSITVSEADNTEMFQQIKRFFVKGCQKDGNILVYSLDSVVEILNLFGQPSAELRQKILYELSSFNPRNPEWQELSEAEIPDNEDVSVATDDDKLNRLCLYDLLAMKESIRLRRSEKMKHYMSSNMEEVSKMEYMLHKVVDRIEEIKEICDKFKCIQV